jgi:hypothetical protein
VHVVDPGALADGLHNPVDSPAVEGGVVIGEQSTAGADVLRVGCGPLGEEFDDVWVHGDHAVVAELADRDSEPVAVVADPGDRVGGELAELGGA